MTFGDWYETYERDGKTTITMKGNGSIQHTVNQSELIELLG